MKLRWVVALGALMAACVAVGWGLGLWEADTTTQVSAPTKPVSPAAPLEQPGAAPAPPASKGPEALDTAAWMLAHSQPAAARAPGPVEDQPPCGDDGLPCPHGQVCLNDACVITACAANSSPKEVCAAANGRPGRCCGGACLDVLADRANCGACGRVCGLGVDCQSGVCQAQSCAGKMAGTACALPQGAGSCCRDRCADKASWIDDNDNCGGCGHACSPGLRCVQGVCVDPATGRLPDFTCNQPGHTCRSDQFCVIDACYPRDCGGGSDGQLCEIGNNGQLGHCCSGSCHDLFSDSDNCRACGVRCGPDQTCKSGECR